MNTPELLDAMKTLQLTPRGAWPTTKELVDAARQHVTRVRRLSDPDAFKIAVENETQRQLEPLAAVRRANALRPGFEQDVRANAERDLRARLVADVGAVRAALTVVDGEIQTRMEAQKRVRPETAAPGSDKALLIRIAEDVAAARFATFVQTRPAAETLRRYEQAQDDDPFVRYLEGPDAAPLHPTGDPLAVAAASTALGAAIRSRRDSRVSPEDREAATALQTLRAELHRAAVDVDPSVSTLAAALTTVGTKAPKPTRTEREDAIRAQARAQEQAEAQAAAAELIGG